MGALDNKVAVVTGAASGIGKAAATLLASEGARVVAVDVNADGAREVADLVGGVSVPADVGQPEHWGQVLDAARTLGGVHVAYFNAGVTTGEPDIAAVTDDQYRRIMAVNIDGVVLGVRALLPDMVAAGGGAMVVTSSLAGIVAFPGDPMYTLTKHALIGFVRSIAPRLLEDGVTVNAVCPGLVDTPLIDGEIRDAMAAAAFPLISPHEVAAAAVGCVLGTETGQAIVVQLGREPVAYRFGRPPGPRVPEAEGKIPPGWLGDPGRSSGPGDQARGTPG
jgi:NAD(P)-dependent dehydrogenase (short-subunit alcohol dehydrogenase family)